MHVIAKINFCVPLMREKRYKIVLLLKEENIYRQINKHHIHSSGNSPRLNVSRLVPAVLSDTYFSIYKGGTYCTVLKVRCFLAVFIRSRYNDPIDLIRRGAEPSDKFQLFN